MAHDPRTDKRRNLLNVIEDVKAAADEAVGFGHGVVETGQFIKQMAGPAKDAVETIPDDSYRTAQDWDRHIAVWQDAATTLRSVAQIDLPIEFTAASTTLSVTNLTYPSTYVHPLPPENQKRAEDAVSRAHNVVEAASWDKDLEADFVRLGRDQARRGDRSPLDLYRAARQSLSRPSAAQPDPTAVLIQVRECVHSVLERLLDKCPGQERTGEASPKVTSICTRIGRSGLSAAQIETLAKQAKDLVKALSSGKQQDLDSRAVRARFLAAVAFVKALLAAVDDNRMKR